LVAGLQQAAYGETYAMTFMRTWILKAFEGLGSMTQGEKRRGVSAAVRASGESPGTFFNRVHRGARPE
jgi:hypothetical protein